MKRSTILSLLTLALVAVSSAYSSPAQALTPDGWEYVGTDDGVVVYKKEVEGSDIVAFKGTIYADLPLAKILAVFVNGEERKHWVDRYAEHKTLEKGENWETYWIHFNVPWPIQDRDYVLKSTGRSDPKNRKVIVDIKSVKSPKKGEDPCCVRAVVHSTYYEFTALKGENKTKIVVEVHTDPKGDIPTWLVNLVQESWPVGTLTNLVKRAKVSKTPALAEYADWHSETLAAAQPAPAPDASASADAEVKPSPTTESSAVQ